MQHENKFQDSRVGNTSPVCFSQGTALHTHFRQEHVSTCIYYKVHVECDLRRLCLLDVVVTCVVVMEVLSTPLRGSLQEYTPFFLKCLF